MLKKLPMKSDLLKHAEVADISMRKKASYSSLDFMLRLFPNLLAAEEINNLDAQFAAYQYEDLDEQSFSRIDAAWGEIGKLTDASGCKKYLALSKLMLAILIIPHSNAPTERIFSIVRKNQTEFRPRLSTKSLSALLVEKTKTLTSGELCYKRTFSDKLLNAAKKATRQALE